MIARNSGIIRVGDTVEVLSTKPPRPYGAGKVVESVQAPQDSEHSVTIEYEGRCLPAITSRSCSSSWNSKASAYLTPAAPGFAAVAALRC